MKNIFRIERKEKDFVMISNALAQDTRISLDARGLMVLLLSKPDNWVIRRTWIKSESCIGDRRLNRIIGELKDAGYIHVAIERNPDGKITGKRYTVHEEPIDHKCYNAIYGEKHRMEKASDGKQHGISKDREKTKKDKNKDRDDINTRAQDEFVMDGKNTIPPSIESAKQYFTGKGKPKDMVYAFMDHFTANGWRVGRNPMKDWQASARTWIRNSAKFERTPKARANGKARPANAAREAYRQQLETHHGGNL